MPIEARHSGVRNSPFFSGLTIPKIVLTSINTAGNVTYTAAQIWGGEIHRDTNGGNRTDTLPTAHDLSFAMRGVEAGSTIDVVIRNDAVTTDVLTVAAGAGGTSSGTMTVAQNATNRFRIRFTNVSYPTEAYEVTGFTASAGGGSGDALVANPLSQFAATTSLQLKGVISDETGSGALVFATSPALVTPVLGVASGSSLKIVPSGFVRVFELDTDASNYSRLSITAPAGGPITFASEAAGTGTARDVKFTGGKVYFGAVGAGFYADTAGSSLVVPYILTAARDYQLSSAGLLAKSTFTVVFTSASTLDDTKDTGVARNAAGVLEVNNGTPGTLRDLKARTLSFGTHSAIAAETVTGYITITDAGGTSRKVAVVS